MAQFGTLPLISNLIIFIAAGLVVSILGEMNRSAFVAWTLGLLITCIFLLGLLERRNRTVLGMGVDSLGVLFTYLIGLGGLYYVRNEPGF